MLSRPRPVSRSVPLSEATTAPRLGCEVADMPSMATSTRRRLGGGDHRGDAHARGVVHMDGHVRQLGAKRLVRVRVRFGFGFGFGFGFD